MIFDEGMKIGTISSMPLFVSAHFHVVQKVAIDWYIGPTIGYIFYGGLDFISLIGGTACRSKTISDMG